MKALVHLSCDEGIPDCTKCTRDVRLREEFGCDEPAWRPCRCYGTDPRCEDCGGTGKIPHVVFTVSCSACGGDGCERCDRDGKYGMMRCPKKLVELRPDVVRAFVACQRFEEHGVLPVAGGTDQQSAPFMFALRIYQHERGVLMEERRKQAEAEKKRAEARARREGRR